MHTKRPRRRAWGFAPRTLARPGGTASRSATRNRTGATGAAARTAGTCPQSRQGISILSVAINRRHRLFSPVRLQPSTASTGSSAPCACSHQPPSPCACSHHPPSTGSSGRCSYNHQPPSPGPSAPCACSHQPPSPGCSGRCWKPPSDLVITANSWLFLTVLDNF
jgi:hypothetical protein